MNSLNTPPDDDRPPPPWPRRRQDMAAVAWPSFLAAAVANMVCFAFVDPAGLGLHRMTGYALGFFLFWTAAAISSVVTLYLVRTARAP